MSAAAPAARPELPGPAAQVGAVLRMRAAGLRGPARRKVTAGLAVIPVLLLAAGPLGTALPADARGDALVLMPTAWLTFALTVTLAAATSGSRMLLPRAQAVPFPLTPAAEHLGGLLLAPLNVAWVVQSVGLLALTGWSIGLRPGLAVALPLTLAWIAAGTVLAHALGWLVELIRSTPAGPWAVRALAAAAATAVAATVATGSFIAVLEASPTVEFVAAVAQAADGAWGALLVSAGALLLSGWVAFRIGELLTVAAARRPARAQARVEARSHPSRPDPASEFEAALRLDRAGVWRSAPLRRGLVALSAVPALAAAVARLDWYLVAILPGLVASGAALLFGVNALSLDGSGAVWRESLPGSPRVHLAARLLVVAELSAIGTAGAIGVAALRATVAPSTAEVLALAGAAFATTAQVVAHCATWSVHRPYAATLRESRDQPAPPAAMAGYSARLAFATTGTGLLMSVLATLDLSAAIVFATISLLALAARRTLAALNSWDDPAVRSRVVAVVAGS